MDSDQESSECPLCLEVLEADDLTFFPCTCCYQICRFCWHRIRTDENGLCPACRKPYSENPAQFKPLTDEELQQVKRDRKLKESNKKPKITESRKHLANLRVVQRNLVFVNGLPARLADTELLRRNDHFGKYGKIIKLVTSPAHNGQLNSICVYITYSRSEEALRAIQSLCNYQVDGRTLKATLGTTKYCSRYLKGASCQKADCLYLHEPGDPAASFTKEQMQQGLHLDYERKLMEQYTNKTTSNTPKTNGNGNKTNSSPRRKGPIPTPLLTTNTNGQSDFESGDENHQINPAFTSTTAINGDTLNGDSDLSSTSSQTSSEHDPSLRTRVSPMKTWPDESINFYSNNTNNNNLVPNEISTVKNYDQLPEYKLFSSNTPSIHSILFGNNENPQTGIDHDLREIEKRLTNNRLDNTSYAQTQENDELGFDPCNLFMSALASDIEDERRPLPSQTSLSYRPTLNSYGYSSTTNNPSWMSQQYHQYHEKQQQQPQQQRYPPSFNGSSPQQMWNGNYHHQQPQQPQQQQYISSIPTRLDYSNQTQARLLPRQPSSQYTQPINTTVPGNNLQSNDRWMNLPWTDPAIISLGNKLDPQTSSQWSTTPQSSTLSSGNNLIPNARWSQQHQPSQPSQSHMLTNGIYMPYSTTSGVDDGSRS